MNRPAREPPPVAEIARRAGLDEGLVALAEATAASRPFVERLLAEDRHPEAVRYLAFALPKSTAVLWACRCARSIPAAAQLGPAEAVAAALEAAERWVADPSEANRRAAGAAGEAVVDTPAGCAALAAFWSGGSLAPADLPAVPPADDLTPRGVGGAVLLAGVIADPFEAPDRYRRFLMTGLDLADAEGPGPTSEPPAPATPGDPPRRGRTSRFLDTWE